MELPTNLSLGKRSLEPKRVAKRRLRHQPAGHHRRLVSIAQTRTGGETSRA